jgi:hypothetical protein
MIYLLGGVVVLFILYSAWREREARLERQEINKAYRLQVSELLTRISHPELVVVPDKPKQVNRIGTEDEETEDDELGMVGTIIPGLPE